MLHWKCSIQPMSRHSLSWPSFCKCSIQPISILSQLPIILQMLHSSNVDSLSLSLSVDHHIADAPFNLSQLTMMWQMLYSTNTKTPSHSWPSCCKCSIQQMSTFSQLTIMLQMFLWTNVHSRSFDCHVAIASFNQFRVPLSVDHHVACQINSNVERIMSFII